MLLSVRLRMALSIAHRWLTSSPADQRPSAGLVFHWSAGTASAVGRNSLWARARFSTMAASDSTIPSIHAERALDGGSSGLLESMGQLQDARLSESRAKDLQAHGQLSVDLP